MSNSVSFRLAANKWVIKARWFLILVVAFLCAAFQISELADFAWTDPAAYLVSPLFFVFILAVLANALLWLIAGMIDLETAHRHVTWLSTLSLAFEIGFISLLFYDLPAARTVVAPLYFLPIVESIVLWGRLGPLIAALLIGLIQNGLVWFSGWLPLVLGRGNRGVDPGPIFIWSLILSVGYLLIGGVSSYIAGSIARRERDLALALEERERQMNELRSANRQLEQEERSLKAKDYELEMANGRLEQLEEAKAKFVSVTAHQLRTPLSGIKWTFDMILSGHLGPVTAEQKEFLSKGFDSVQRTIRIVNDLLHVDHMEAAKLEFSFGPVDLGKLIDSVCFEFSNQAKSKQIELKIDLPGQSVPPVSADETKLRVVLENLIDNAIKYTPSGGRVLVTLSGKRLNSAVPAVSVSVADSGIGILEADRTKIFSKFYRAENAIRVEPDGSGIGLYMSKDIAEKHGGSLTYEQAPGGGTVFHLYLPVKQS